MRITDPNVTLWTQLGPEESGGPAREHPLAPQPAVVVALNVLDTDHDGWLDEDDLPYDQVLLLERARATPAPATAAPQIDLLA